MYNVKQVILVRKDLNMRKGKFAAQCAHASMKVFFDRGSVEPDLRPVVCRSGKLILYQGEVCTAGSCSRPLGHSGPHNQFDGPGPYADPLHPEVINLTVPLSPEMIEWVNGSFAKVVLFVENEEDLLKAYELAQEARLPCALITDNGYTEFHGVHTNTTVAIGPAIVEDIDRITGPEGLVATKLA